MNYNGSSSNINDYFELLSGTLVAKKDVSFDKEVTIADLIVSGDLTVNGTTTSINATEIDIEDTLLLLGSNNNTTDLLNLGLLTEYGDSGAKYSGLVRNSSNSEWYLFQDASTKPTSSTDISSLTTANINVGLVNNVSINTLNTHTTNVNNPHSVSLAQLGVTNGVESLSSAEITQLSNIDSKTITNTQWGYLGSMDQGVSTSGTPSFDTLNLTGTGDGTLTIDNIQQDHHECVLSEIAFTSGFPTTNTITIYPVAVSPATPDILTGSTSYTAQNTTNTGQQVTIDLVGTFKYQVSYSVSCQMGVNDAIVRFGVYLNGILIPQTVCFQKRLNNKIENLGNDCFQELTNGDILDIRVDCDTADVDIDVFSWSLDLQRLNSNSL